MLESVPTERSSGRPFDWSIDVRRAEAENLRRTKSEREVGVSWSLKGSYVETCSCELMCPCNLSFDHGATYDYCRVTLVFNIREGEIEGTDVGGLKVAAIATRRRS